MFDHDDFSHLDDPTPHSLGTDHQLAAARNRGRELARHTRRTRLAAGSAAVAATAGVSAIAVVGLPGRSVAGTTADSSASPYPIPTPTASSSPTPVPATATVSPVPAPTSSAQPYPSPSVSVTVPAPGRATVSPTAAPVPPAPSLSAVPTVNPLPLPLPVTPTGSPVPTTTATPVPTATTMTPDCAAVTSALKTTPLPEGYTPYSQPGTVIGWQRPQSPLSTVVLTVSCSAFSPTDVPASEGPVREVTSPKDVPVSERPAKEVTQFDPHMWLIGDATSGNLKLVWNANSTTSVTLTSTSAVFDIPTQVEDQLLVFRNYLVD